MNIKNFYTKINCRLCNSDNIQLVLPLNKSPLCDEYLKEPRKQEFFDLNSYMCIDCGFVQIDTIIDPEVIYRNYIYLTTSSPGLIKHFETYASEVCSALNIESSKLTVDIGSNDGSLLSYFKEKNHRVLGIEPSLNTAEDATKNGIETLPIFFDESEAKKIVSKYGKADLVTINNLYANIDDLESFTKGLEILLDDDGVLIIESSYLLNAIKNMVFDFIYHEHLSYFSILPLEKFLKKFGLKLIRLDKVSTKGGSMRYFCARDNSRWDVDENVEKLKEEEVKANIGIGVFQEFQSKINNLKKDLTDFLKSQGNKNIVGYGASATSTTLISHFNLDQYFSCLIDDNPAKVGTYSPGYHIPVYGVEKLEEETPDIIIILAWRFYEQILPKLNRMKSQIILPLPTFKKL
jgi:hypothetical protein